MEKLLKVEQLSELIQVSPSTIYHWAQADFIPHYQLPKGIRFKSDEVISWLKRKHVKGRDLYKINIE